MSIMDGVIDVKIRDGFGLFASIGSFAVCHKKNNKFKASEFIYCREHFHKIHPTGWILFHARASHISATVSFLRRVEEELGLKNRSKFYSTQRKTILLIKVNSWWNYYPVRRSFFTVLIRAGKKYKSRKDNFENVIVEGNEYLRVTKLAVRRFISGYTKLKGKFKGGWVEQFMHQDEERINAILVKP